MLLSSMTSKDLKGIIVVIGAPASGKTTIAKTLSEILNCKYINAGELAIERGFLLGEDQVRRSLILDEDPIKEEILSLLKENGCLIVETISPGVIPREKVVAVVAVRCRPSILVKRLRDRGYPSEKIRENLEYEVIDGPLYDGMEISSEDRIIEVDGCEGNLRDELGKIMKFLMGERFKLGTFNWMRDFMKLLDDLASNKGNTL